MAEKAARTKKAPTGKQKRRAGTQPPVERPPAGEEPFPLVAVGASAGGLEAFEQLFKHLPPTTHAAFVVISHLDPKHASMMTELISRFTPMAVQEAADGVAVEPDHVYVITPNKDLSIFHGRLQLTEQESRRARGCLSTSSCALLPRTRATGPSSLSCRAPGRMGRWTPGRAGRRRHGLRAGPRRCQV